MSLCNLLLDHLDGKQPFEGDSRNNEDVDKWFRLDETDARQLNLLLLSLCFSPSLSNVKQRGSCCTSDTLMALCKKQLKDEPTISKIDK